MNVLGSLDVTLELQCHSLECSNTLGSLEFQYNLLKCQCLFFSKKVDDETTIDGNNANANAGWLVDCMWI